MRTKLSSLAIVRPLVFIAISVLTPSPGSAQDLVHAAMCPPERDATAAFSEPEEPLKATLGRLLVPPLPGKAPTLLPPLIVPEHARRVSEGAASSQPRRSRGSGIGWGIAIGIGAGIAASGVAAAKYGENEGGEFCGRCFAQWSAVTIPVGAGIGAAVAYVIDRAHR